MSQENFYHDFETLLLSDWEKAVKGDLTRLRISGGTPELDIEAWERINDQHGEEFGLDKKHIQYLRLVKKIAILELDYIVKEDEFIKNLIEIAQEELENVLKKMQGNNTSIQDTLFALSERAGYRITASTITVKDFFGMINYYSKKSDNGKEV